MKRTSVSGRQLFSRRKPGGNKGAGSKRQKVAKKPAAKPFTSANLAPSDDEADKEVHNSDFYFKQQLTDEERAERQQQLNQLRQDVHDQAANLPLMEWVNEDCKVVFSRGNIDASLMIVGEAPGADEAAAGKPFVGASGKKLDEFLKKYGIKQEHIYVTNIVMVRPPRNRDPTWEEVSAYTPFLRRHIAIIKPKVILCMGRFSTTVLRSGLKNVESIRGDPSRTVPDAFSVDTVTLNDFYRQQSNMGSLMLPAERFCCQFYAAYHPASILHEETEIENKRKAEPNVRHRAQRKERWENDFKTVAAALLEPALEFIDAAELVRDTYREGFEFSKRSDTFYNSTSLSMADQLNYVHHNGDTLEFEVHSVEYHSYKNVFNVYGRTADNHSVCLEVTQPRMDFWIGHKDIKNGQVAQEDLDRMQQEINQEMGQVANGRRKYQQMTDLSSVDCKLTLTQQRDYIKHNPTLKPYVKVGYLQEDLKFELKKQLERLWPGLKFYESSIQPDKQFEYANDIYVRGWVEIPGFSTLECQAENKQSLCDLEYTVYASDVKGYSPNPGESGDVKWERNAPVRVLSLDGEMLNKGGRFPRAEQDPIVSICAYSSTSNRPDGKNFIEKVRNPGAGKSTEFKTTGRSNYDDAVAFAVGSVDDISTEKFHISSLPNVPDPPVDSVARLKRGVEDSGAYKKSYVVDIRKWNKWIEDIAAWLKAVGRRRAKRVLKDSGLYEAVVALSERPDGTDPKTNWQEAEILKWEALADKVRSLWPRRAKKDIRNFNEGVSWLEEFAALDYDAREVEFGEIQTRWEMFRPKKRVFAFETEEEMIRGFYKYVQEYDADVVTGYNISSFDLPYFIRRVEVLDIRDEKTGKLLSMGRFRDREDKDVIKVSSSKATGERVFHTINVPGRDCYDFMHYIMRDHKLQSYQLAFVAQSFLGDTKNDVPYSAIPSLFRNNRERLNDYCLKDAELVLMLMSYLNNMNFLTALARLIGTIPLERLYVDGKQSQVMPRFLITHRCSPASSAFCARRASARSCPMTTRTACLTRRAKRASPTRARTCSCRRRSVSSRSCCSAWTMPRCTRASLSRSTSATTWPALPSTCSSTASSWRTASRPRAASWCPTSRAKSSTLPLPSFTTFCCTA